MRRMDLVAVTTFMITNDALEGVLNGSRPAALGTMEERSDCSVNANDHSFDVHHLCVCRYYCFEESSIDSSTGLDRQREYP